MSLLSEEQTLLRDAAKAWAQEKSPVAALRKLRDSGSKTGFDKAAWAEMGEMGWAGVIVPEEYGGSGFGYRGMGLVLEETGRTLTASPLLSSALVAASALVIGGNAAQKKDYLPRIASGALIAALALGASAHHAPERVALKATKSGDTWRLDGKKTYVPDGAAADLLIVVARDGRDLRVFLVPVNTPGVTRTALRTVDTRGAADVVFANVSVPAPNELQGPGDGSPWLENVLDRARTGLAAEMLGAATQAFEITLDYLKTRTQFGQVIGSFQSLQHRAAKMFTEIELTRSCVEAALDAIDAGRDDVAALASLAKAKASDTLHLVSSEMVQMHGGIGMTDAHDAGLYMKRARVAEALYGGSAFHRDRYARLSGF